MGIIFIVGLVFVVFYLDEVGVCGRRVEGEGDEGVDGGGFGDDFEGPGLRGGAGCQYVCCMKRIGDGGGKGLLVRCGIG